VRKGEKRWEKARKGVKNVPDIFDNTEGQSLRGGKALSK
jgi:hypothetical protein